MLTTAHYPLFISLIKRISDNFKIRIINRLAHRVKISKYSLLKLLFTE